MAYGKGSPLIGSDGRISPKYLPTGPGVAGPKGDTGPKGVAGPKGDTGAASTVAGPPGPKGEVGASGAPATVYFVENYAALPPGTPDGAIVFSRTGI